MGKSIKIIVSVIILLGIAGAIYYFFYYTPNMTMDEVIYEESIDSNEDGLDMEEDELKTVVVYRIDDLNAENLVEHQEAFQTDDSEIMTDIYDEIKNLEVEYLGNTNDRVSGDWEIIDGDTNYNITIYGPQIDGELSGFQLAFNEDLEEFIVWHNEVYGITDGSLDGLREYINNLDVEWEPGADFQFDNSGL